MTKINSSRRQQLTGTWQNWDSLSLVVSNKGCDTVSTKQFYSWHIKVSLKHNIYDETWPNEYGCHMFNWNITQLSLARHMGFSNL